jgi:hypothetical protein
MRFAEALVRTPIKDIKIKSWDEYDPTAQLL